MVRENQSVSNDNILSACGRKYYDLGNIIWCQRLATARQSLIYTSVAIQSTVDHLPVDGIGLSLVSIKSNNGEFLSQVSPQKGYVLRKDSEPFQLDQGRFQ